MKQFFLTICLFFAALVCANAQSPFGAPQQGSEPKAPELEYVVRLHVTLDPAFLSETQGRVPVLSFPLPEVLLRDPA